MELRRWSSNLCFYTSVLPSSMPSSCWLVDRWGKQVYIKHLVTLNLFFCLFISLFCRGRMECLWSSLMDWCDSIVHEWTHGIVSSPLRPLTNQGKLCWGTHAYCMYVSVFYVNRWWVLKASCVCFLASRSFIGFMRWSGSNGRSDFMQCHTITIQGCAKPVWAETSCVYVCHRLDGVGSTGLMIYLVLRFSSLKVFIVTII